MSRYFNNSLPRARSQRSFIQQVVVLQRHLEDLVKHLIFCQLKSLVKLRKHASDAVSQDAKELGVASKSVLKHPATIEAIMTESERGALSESYDLSQRHEEFQYLDLIRNILENGEHRPDRYAQWASKCQFNPAHPRTEQEQVHSPSSHPQPSASPSPGPHPIGHPPRSQYSHS